MVTFVVPNLSPSDYLNLPVPVDNKLLAIKKKGQSYFAYLANKYGIGTYLGIPRVVVASLAVILYVQAWGNWGGRPGHGLANILHPFHTDLHTMSLGVASINTTWPGQNPFVSPTPVYVLTYAFQK